MISSACSTRLNSFLLFRMACCIMRCSSLSKESNSKRAVFVRTLFFLDCIHISYSNVSINTAFNDEGEI